MKITKHLLMPFIGIISAVSINAQTAEDIIAKHIDAIGGKDKLASLTSVRMEGTAEVMGTEAPTVTTVLYGKGFRNESEFNGQKVVRVYTDKGGWAINPFAGGDEPQALPDEQYKAGEDQIYVDPFFDYAARAPRLNCRGRKR